MHACMHACKDARMQDSLHPVRAAHRNENETIFYFSVRAGLGPRERHREEWEQILKLVALLAYQKGRLFDRGQHVVAP